MRVHSVKLKNNSNIVSTVAALIFAVLLIVYSDAVKTAASVAIDSCLNTVIPCIFPFLTISYFVLEAGFPATLRYITDNFLKTAFGLSGNCAEAVFLGLTGGYVSAAKSALKLRNNNEVSDEQAKRLVLFFTNPGISFTVILTGMTAAGSFFFGLRLYIISVAANILIAFLYNKFNKNTDNIPIYTNKTNPAEAFTNAVSKSSASIISISFSIILFACISCTVNKFFSFGFVNKTIILLSEITSAVFFSAKNFPLYVLAGLLPFGGFCIFIQLMPDLVKLKIHPLNYISARIMHGVICLVTEFIISIFFPVTECTSAFYYSAKLNKGNPIGSAALLFLFAVYLISVKDIRAKREITTNNVKQLQ